MSTINEQHAESTSAFRAILKNATVVDANSQVIPVSEESPATGASRPAGSMQARIIQNTDAQCVIEVRCSCGCISRLVGEYA